MPEKGPGKEDALIREGEGKGFLKGNGERKWGDEEELTDEEIRKAIHPEEMPPKPATEKEKSEKKGK